MQSAPYQQLSDRDTHFWVATLLRGLLALLVGSGAMVIPDMASTLLLLPFAVTLSVLCLATYGVLDSAIVFVTSFMLPSATEAAVLRIQGTFGIAFGVTLLFIVYDKVHLHWFLYIIGAQALCTAIAEFIIARHARTRGSGIRNYAAAAAAFLFAVAYSVLAPNAERDREPREIAWLIFGYLLAFGMAQCLTAASVLYARKHHPPLTGTHA